MTVNPDRLCKVPLTDHQMEMLWNAVSIARRTLTDDNWKQGPLSRLYGVLDQNNYCDVCGDPVERDNQPVTTGGWHGGHEYRWVNGQVVQIRCRCPKHPYLGEELDRARDY